MLTFQVSENWLSIIGFQFVFSKPSVPHALLPLPERTTRRLSAKVDYFLKLPTGAVGM